MKTPRASSPEFYPRIRILVGTEIALGPGKVDLLRCVAATGSIREAAGQLGMSYMRAWTLIRTMNECFPEPLVTAARGGRDRGGATLTAMGLEALTLYNAMEKACHRASQEPWQKLKRLLAAGAGGKTGRPARKR